MIHSRFSEKFDAHIVDFQYGYRKHQSSAQPVFNVRRLMDIAEATGSSLYVMALNYQKVFNSIPHEVLMKTLSRYDIPSQLLKLINNMYTAPKFRVKGKAGLSDEHMQAVGTRLGCPLSPFLILFCTSALMTDALHDYYHLYRAYLHQLLQGLKYPILLYPDDTLLIAKNNLEMQRLFRCVINKSEEYNLKLNYEKCKLAIGQDGNVFFPDGNNIEFVQQLTYLGALLRKDSQSKPI
eukprot:5680485-Amphidinium_carterae.1